MAESCDAEHGDDENRVCGHCERGDDELNRSGDGVNGGNDGAEQYENGDRDAERYGRRQKKQQKGNGEQDGGFEHDVTNRQIFEKRRGNRRDNSRTRHQCCTRT